MVISIKKRKDGEGVKKRLVQKRKPSIHAATFATEIIWSFLLFTFYIYDFYVIFLVRVIFLFICYMFKLFVNNL